MASRMNPAKYETTSIKIAAGEYRFSVAASKNVFEGFRAVYVEADEEKEENNVLVKSIDKDSKLTKEELIQNSTLHSRRHIIQRHHL